MFYRILLIAAISLVFATGFLARKRLDVPLQPEVAPRWQCRRIVSLAPSITATLYALGLGDRVVGVICAKGCAEGDSPIFADTKIGTVPNTKIGTVPDYPPEVKDMARVGDLFDPNYEAILALKPDLVIALEEQSPSVQALSRLKVETLVVDHKTIEGIVESFGVIGRVCGKGQEGRRLEKDWGK